MKRLTKKISVNQSAAYFYRQIPTLCGSRKYPYQRQGWSLEIPKGEGGGGGGRGGGGDLNSPSF